MSKPEFIYVTYIETTPEKLWEALTSSEFSRQYWFGTELRTDWTIGSPFALVMNGTQTDVGEILEFERPRRLSYTFRHVLKDELRNERPTKVVFTIEQHGKFAKNEPKNFRRIEVPRCLARDFYFVRTACGSGRLTVGNGAR